MSPGGGDDVTHVGVVTFCAAGGVLRGTGSFGRQRLLTETFLGELVRGSSSELYRLVELGKFSAQMFNGFHRLRQAVEFACPVGGGAFNMAALGEVGLDALLYVVRFFSC